MKCAYCSKDAVGHDALGLDACTDHLREADDYFEERTGRRPDEDPFLYCDVHCDMWEPSCPRCEECSQHHYGISVAEFLRSPLSQTVIISMQRI